MITDRRLIVAAAVAAVLLLAWWKHTPALPVDATNVSRGPLALLVTTNGKVEPVEDAEVRARLDGRIVQIPDPGTKVAKGDVILRIDSGPVAAELAKAQGERLSILEKLRDARSKLAQQKERAATDQKLFEQGALTSETNAASQAALHDARARVEFLERETPLRVDSLDLRIREYQDQLGSAEVHAPFAGTVYRTEQRKGAMVHVGDPILWVADLGHLRVRTNIDQVDLGRVHAGQKVTISANAFPNRTWAGTVTEVIPHVVVRQSRSISEGLAEVTPPTDGLVPGMSVDVDVVVTRAPDALHIPAQAVVHSDGQPYVYRLAGNRARRTPVKLGLETVNEVEVVAGLSDGDHVVVSPLRDLHDGERVEARLRHVGSD